MKLKDIEFEFKKEFDQKKTWIMSEIDKIKTGRANINVLNDIFIDYYGEKTKLIEVANIKVVDGRRISIKPYEKTIVKEVVGAINKKNIGINPQVDADTIYLTFAPLSEDLRKESVKKVKEIIEKGKSEVRNTRKNIHHKIKTDESLTEDDLRYFENELDKLTKKYNQELDAIFLEKEQMLLKI